MMWILGFYHLLFLSFGLLFCNSYITLFSYLNHIFFFILIYFIIFFFYFIIFVYREVHALIRRFIVWMLQYRTSISGNFAL